MPKPDSIQPPDAAARDMARMLMSVPHAALAVTDPDTNTPGISRIALGRDAQGTPVTLISALSAHHRALATSPDCAIMVGDPGPRGDPLTHPRLMIQCRAAFIDRTDPGQPALRDGWLRSHPKAKLYIDFTDFTFVRLTPISALLNAGFGKAYRLTPTDLT